MSTLIKLFKKSPMLIKEKIQKNIKSPILLLTTGNNIAMFSSSFFPIYTHT